jgi:hydroxyethylthiazole kinase
MRDSRHAEGHRLPHAAAALADALRARGPRVHCITNTVAQAYTANMLLAAGCVPSMTLSAEEIGGFVASADALVANLGTFDAERRAATLTAVEAARDRALPWVLDPVFVDRSAPRLAFARELVAKGPRVVRLNQAEFEALAGASARQENAVALARDTGAIIAISGPTDLVTDGTRVVTIANGHSFMAKVTAMGCAGSALVAAFLAIEPDALRATAAALMMLGIAGELAARDVKGPGTFATAIIDEVHALDAAALLAHAKAS